ncbi:extracellular solute-binding protein [Schaalia sp. ZJ1691]|uniref:extracellular solute-binding protein n=1 Tax=Schaalia sp. ZJ1691 TaxID=2709404 RepID=UPI00197D0938|nr:extracellular solute-binding protein [Schaalia sp. ZJ1691]
MSMKRIIAAVAMTGLALGGLTACGGNSSGDGGAPGDGEGKKLVLYSSMTENDLNVLTDLLKDEFPGIDIEIVNGSAGELTARIQSEAGNPQGDMMWGGLDVSNGDAHKDIFEHWLSEHEDTLQPQYKSPNGFYNVDHLSTVAFAVNKDLEKELGLNIKGYADLLNPKLKGKITMADPTSSSSAWNNISNIMSVFGNGSDESYSYIDKLLANDLVIASSSSIPFTAVADGEYVVGLTYEDGIASLLKSGTDNIRMVYPAEGTSATAFGTAVIQGAPHADVAKDVISYIMSPKGQVAFAETVGTVRVTTSEKYSSEFLPATDEITWVERDVEWLTEHRDEVIAKWTELFTSHQK